MATVQVENRSSYGELVRGVGVQFLDVFNQSLNSYSLAMDSMYAEPGNKMTALAKKLTTNSSQVHLVQKTGVNYLQTMEEGAAFNSDSRLLSYKTSVPVRDWSQSISVTRNAIKDSDYRQQLDEFADLTRSGLETMDKSFFDGIFNLAFTAQSSLPTWVSVFGDGKPHVSTSHPRKDGGTAQLNTFSSGTTQLTLTDTNLETARISVLRQLDDRGKPGSSGSSKLVLVVPPELEKDAIIITKSERRSGTANNDVNIYDGPQFSVVSSKWVGYSGNPGSAVTTSWFLVDPKIAKLYFVLRQGLEMHRHVNPDSLTSTFYVDCRFAVATGDWRGFFGSLGDGSAYSS